MTIYELTGEFLQFSDLAEQMELTEEQKTMLDEALNNLVEDIDNKLEGYAKVIKNFEADIDGIKAEERRLASRRKVLENRISNMKEAMALAMITTNKQKVKGNLFTISMQNNPASVVMDEEDLTLIPGHYLRMKDPELDKKKIKEDLEAGVELSFAHLEQTQSLRIR